MELLFSSRNLRKIEALGYILKHLINSNYITYSKPYNTLKSLGYKIGKETVIRYVRHIEDIFFSYLLRIYGSLKKQEQNSKKVYIIDNIFLKKYGVKVDFGRFMENVVCIDLLRRISYNFLDVKLFYFKTKEGYEVDFLIKEGERIEELIQVIYVNDFDEIDRREIRALLHANELFKGDKPRLKVITWDYEDEKEISWFGKRGKIEFVPLWRWLLETKFIKFVS